MQESNILILWDYLSRFAARRKTMASKPQPPWGLHVVTARVVRQGLPDSCARLDSVFLEAEKQAESKDVVGLDV
jgi:hypothetical protein